MIQIINSIPILASQPAFIYLNKGWLLPDHSFSGHHVNSFSDFQGTGSLCLEKRYQNNFLQPQNSLKCFAAVPILKSFWQENELQVKN